MKDFDNNKSVEVLTILIADSDIDICIAVKCLNNGSACNIFDHIIEAIDSLDCA